ncbi:MAG: CapA family protein [Ignavibacteriae bacterium]|nr:CapA family protein [Ignavibacteriota bacterium]
MRHLLCIGLVTFSAWSSFAQSGPEGDKEGQLVFRAFGDVNLGRAVGKELLKGNLNYPFASLSGFADGADVVFINLESQLTDQGGETQDPRDVFIFCGPPEGATSLRNAGVTVASTANNHAYDYGMRALEETIDNLLGVGIRAVGTSKDSTGLFQPVFIEKDGIRIAIVAYTEFVNRKGPWRGRISLFEKKRAQVEIKRARQFSDIVIASYHGGSEYTDEPSKLALSQMRYLAEIGADVVVGHHSHVPQGIEYRQGKYIFYSLGNFVFYQPQHFWTQFGLGVELKFQKKGETVVVSSIKMIPIRAGKQPTFSLSKEERSKIHERLQKLSNVTIQQLDSAFTVQPLVYE